MRFKQIPYANWPKELCKRAGLLDLQPADLEQNYNILFTETSDQFDYLKLAALELATGEQYAFIQFRGSKRLGTEIWISESVKDIDAALFLFFTRLDIPVEHLRWKRTDE